MRKTVNYMESNSIGILPGPRSSFLDHLVPLCQLMNIPLYCTERWVAELGEIFYPPMTLLKKVQLENYQTFLYVEPAKTALGSYQLGHLLHKGSAQSICGFHGNSDKNLDTFWLERLVEEDIILIYGNYLLDFLKRKGILSRLKQLIVTGNYRYAFYEKHRHFFDALARPHLFSNSARKTILYAPTWSYQDRHATWNSPFFTTVSWVLDTLPKEFQMFVKLHPFYFYLYPQVAEEIKHRYKEHENIHFLDEIPLIYPFLEKTDIYLGDYSSVGYDFLFYNRPMFFLNTHQEMLLSCCGKKIEKADLPKMYHMICKDDQKELSVHRKQLYHYAFGPSKPFDLLSNEINQALSKAST